MRRSGTEARVSRSIAFLLFAVLVLSVLATLSLPGPVPPGGVPSPAVASGPNPPRGIHLSYLDDPASAVFTWHTTSAASSRADWGTTSGGPYPFSATGSNYTSPGGSFLHAVTLTGLTPGTRYYYRVGDETMASSYGEASFRAALPSDSGESFTFAAAGDFGNNSGVAAVAQGIGARNPDIVLPLGDIYYSPKESVVKGVFEKFQAFGQGSFVQMAMGNHEYLISNTTDTPTEVHCAFVNQPGNERTYAFTFGNTLFVALDWGPSAKVTTDGVDGTGPACGGAAGSTAIRAWLDERLAAANADPNIRWKVVYQHYQCYDTTTYKYFYMCPQGTQTLDQMEDILTNRGVDLVLYGHNHVYGRTHPVRFDTLVQDGSRYDTPGAPIYVLIGTGGGPSTITCRSEPWVASCPAGARALGFGHFTVSPTTIRYEFVENAAGVLDTFTLTKRPSSGYAASVEPTALQMTPSQTGNARIDVLGTSADPVVLSVSGCPADTTCTVSPASGFPGFDSTLRIDTGPSAPRGTFDLTIAATNATTSKTVPFHLTIADRITHRFQKADGGSYGETDDAFIHSGAPGTNYGKDGKLRVDGLDCITSGGVCKTLLKFPLLIGAGYGQVPAGSTISGASLELTVTNAGKTQDVYQVTETWAETTATWNSFATPGTPGNKGREFTFSATNTGRIALDVTSIVQRWANGDGNEGILLASTHSSGVTYASSEAPNRPALVVQFVPPGGPPPPPPPFDFSLSVSPTSGTVAPGGSTAAVVTATLVSGSSHDVAFSCADLPLDASCTPTPSACSPTCTTALVLATAVTTPEGTYSVRLQATDGTLTRATTFALTVAAPPPPPPPPPPGPYPTRLTIEPTSPDPSATGASVSLSAVLTRTDSGAALAGKPIAFEASDDNGATWWSAGSATTDGSGRARGQTVFGSPGDKLVRARFAGDADFVASNSANESHRVNDGPATLTFRKGDGGAYGETDDSYIYDGARDTNYGSQAALQVDGSGCIATGTICRALLMFPDFLGPNAGQVPAGATILSATLQVTLFDSGGTQLLYQVTELWTESGVTWNAFATPGMPGSKGATISFPAYPVGVITVNITTIVQNWANGDPNHGIFIWSTSTNGADYRSSESTAPPVLTVTFRPPPPPPMEMRGSAAELPEDTGSPQEATVPTIRRLEVRTREPC